jgi:hypothetical protein
MGHRMSYIPSVVLGAITSSPIRIFLAGVCLGIGIATFFAAELLRRLGKQYEQAEPTRNGQTNGPQKLSRPRVCSWTIDAVDSAVIKH